MTCAKTSSTPSGCWRSTALLRGGRIEPGAGDWVRPGRVQCRGHGAAATPFVRHPRPADVPSWRVVDHRTGIRVVPQLPRLAGAYAKVRDAGCLACRDVHTGRRAERTTSDRQPRVEQLLLDPTGGETVNPDPSLSGDPGSAAPVLDHWVGSVTPTDAELHRRDQRHQERACRP